ncbi:MAG: transcription elongation factor GreB, partial [Myxococcota bacterium]
MSSVPNYITTAGFARLRQELRRLLHVERPKTVEDVSVAAAHGDRSENAEYKYGKRKLRAMDRRIYFLTKRVQAAEVVDPSVDRGDRVFFGATVVLEDLEGVETTYQLVGEDEIETESNRLSWRSPVGLALLRKRLDDEV